MDFSAAYDNPELREATEILKDWMNKNDSPFTFEKLCDDLMETHGFNLLEKINRALLRLKVAGELQVTYKLMNIATKNILTNYTIEFDPDVAEEDQHRFLDNLRKEIESANGKMTVISQCDQPMGFDCEQYRVVPFYNIVEKGGNSENSNNDRS